MNNKESQAIEIGQDYTTKKHYILNDEWPKQITVTLNLLEAGLPCLVIDKDFLMFTLENGTAKYIKKDKDHYGNLVCQLISSTYKKQP